MSQVLNIQNIKELFNEFVESEKIRLKRRESFAEFINFLEIDFYDWVRDNLKYYFRENKQVINEKES